MKPQYALRAARAALVHMKRLRVPCRPTDSALPVPRDAVLGRSFLRIALQQVICSAKSVRRSVHLGIIFHRLALLTLMPHAQSAIQAVEIAVVDSRQIA